MTKDRIQAFTRRIVNANKTEMIVILYDIGLYYIDEAVEFLKNDDKASFRNSIDKERAVLRELMGSVDPSNEIGKNILSLYIFAKKELTAAYINLNSEPLKAVENIFKGLRDAYDKISSLDTSGVIMQHTENVYAGLTYGRNSLKEQVAGTDLNRGYLV